MKTFLEYNENNNTDAQIEQLAYNIAELGINPLEIIGEMTENIISKLDNKEDKIRIALIEQEIIEGVGDWIGKTAGKAVNAAGGFFSDMGKAYKNQRNNRPGQQPPQAPQQGQAQPAPQQGQAQPAPEPQQVQQVQQIAQDLKQFTDKLTQAGYADKVKSELTALQTKLEKLMNPNDSSQLMGSKDKPVSTSYGAGWGSEEVPR